MRVVEAVFSLLRRSRKSRLLYSPSTLTQLRVLNIGTRENETIEAFLCALTSAIDMREKCSPTLSRTHICKVRRLRYTFP